MTSALDWNFTYNGENQLLQANDGTSIINYEYDVNGLRTKKAVEGGKTERYYYNRGELAYITDNNNTLKYFFVRDTSGRLLKYIHTKKRNKISSNKISSS